MKLQGKWLWRGALTLLALALAWLWLRPTPVTTLTLAAQPVQRSVVATGRVEAIRESVLGSTVTARVVATPVKQGAHVAAGATLLLLESDELLALRAQAEAQLRDADSQLSEARRQWQRQQALFAQGFISQAALDAARRTLDAAEQRQAQTRGALAQSQAKLEQMTVRAPADGVLLTRDVEAGDVVTAGKTLLRFASDGPRRVLLDLDERDLGKVALGQTAAVLADAFPQLRAPAVVSRINASVDNARGTVEIELALTAAAEHLRSGMTVSAEILTRPTRPFPLCSRANSPRTRSKIHPRCARRSRLALAFHSLPQSMGVAGTRESSSITTTALNVCT
jgi:HlyD family secretion protein